jgi:hypothetical protein
MNTPKIIIKEEKKLSEFEQKVEQAKADAEQKCIELKAEHGVVYPLVFSRPSTEEVFVGFIKEPKRAAKMEAFDILMAKNSMSLAGELVLTTSIIKEHSHEAFYLIEDPRYDDVYMGGCIDSLGHINVLMNSLKKK